jgi:toxin ParE1/3/4
MKVGFTPSVLQQFLHAVGYILRDSRRGRGHSQTGRELAAAPARFPESGRLLPEFPDLLSREVRVSPYPSSTPSGTRSSGWSWRGTGRSFRKSRAQVDASGGLQRSSLVALLGEWRTVLPWTWRLEPISTWPRRR